MKTDQADDPRTVLAVLYGTADDAPRRAERELARGLDGLRQHVLADVPETMRKAAVGAVAAAAVGLLGIGLGGLVVEGWREHHDLTAAARRTLAAPGSTELVRLADHSVTVTRQPSIGILVNGADVATVQLTLTLTFDISVLVAEVSAGRLTALHSGRCAVTAELDIQGVQVVTRQTEIKLTGVLSLHDGIRLLPEQDYAPARRGAAAVG
jgi:hypothetical protein